MAKPLTKTKKKTMQPAAPFASLMKLNASEQNEDEQARRAEKEEEWAKKAETDPDREQMEDESDDDYAARMEELDEEEKKADGEIIEDDPDAEENDEDDEKPNAKAARSSERKRCARIIAHGIKAGNVHQAAVFAFDTGLTATQAISAMNAAKIDTSRGGGLGVKMQGVGNYQVGIDVGGNNHKGQNKSTAQANDILKSLEAVRGK